MAKGKQYSMRKWKHQHFSQSYILISSFLNILLSETFCSSIFITYLVFMDSSETEALYFEEKPWTDVYRKHVKEIPTQKQLLRTTCTGVCKALVEGRSWTQIKNSKVKGEITYNTLSHNTASLIQYSSVFLLWKGRLRGIMEMKF